MSPDLGAISPAASCGGFTGSCPSGQTLQWTVGDLGPGEQYVASYTGLVSTGALDGALLTAAATVTATGVGAVHDSHTVVVIE